jgi:hypothetical protein
MNIEKAPLVKHNKFSKFEQQIQRDSDHDYYMKQFEVVLKDSMAEHDDAVRFLKNMGWKSPEEVREITQNMAKEYKNNHDDHIKQARKDAYKEVEEWLEKRYDKLPGITIYDIDSLKSGKGVR